MLTGLVGNAIFENRRGMKIMGRHKVANVNAAAGNTVTLVATGSAILNSNSFYVSPINLGGPLATLGGAFLQYQFTHLEVTYVPFTNVNTTGEITMAFNPDAGGATSVPTANMGTMSSAMSIQPWATNRTVCDPDLDRSRVYQMYASAGTLAELREDHQGLFLINGTTSLTSGSLGTLWVSYEVMVFSMAQESTIQATMPVNSLARRVIHLRKQADEAAALLRERMKPSVNKDLLGDVKTLLKDNEEYFKLSNEQGESIPTRRTEEGKSSADVSAAAISSPASFLRTFGRSKE